MCPLAPGRVGGEAMACRGAASCCCFGLGGNGGGGSDSRTGLLLEAAARSLAAAGLEESKCFEALSGGSQLLRGAGVSLVPLGWGVQELPASWRGGEAACLEIGQVAGWRCPGDAAMPAHGQAKGGTPWHWDEERGGARGPKRSSSP